MITGRACFLVVVVAMAMPAPAPAEERGYIGVSVKVSPDGGLLIMQVIDDSPAANAGLKENDRIQKIDGEDASALESFVMKIWKSKPGTEIKLQILRGTDEKEIKVRVAKRPE